MPAAAVRYERDIPSRIRERNRLNAARGEALLVAYSAMVVREDDPEARLEDDMYASAAEVMRDALLDLMHLANREGIDYKNVQALALREMRKERA
jgi:hypothetical protein